LFGVQLGVLIALSISTPLAWLPAQPIAQPIAHDLVLELGAMQVRQPTIASQSGAFFSVVASGVWSRFSADAHGVFVNTSGGALASQLGLSANAAIPRIDAARFEIGTALTSFGAFTNPRANRGTQATLLARQHLQRERSGVFVGTGVGRAAGFDRQARASLVETGAWASHRTLTASLSAQRAMTTDWLLMEAAGYVLSRPARAYHVQDAALSIRAQTSLADVFVAHSWRVGLGATTGSSRALSAGATWHAATRWSLSFSAGAQLADIVRGLPESRLSSLSVRWRRSPSPDGAASTRDPLRSGILYTSARNADLGSPEATLEVTNDSTALRLRIVAAPNDTVEVAGSFDDWVPYRLAVDGTHHSARIHISPGAYRVAIRVNGGAWRAPRGLVRIADGLGGENGVLIVP